jgi:hypothetical protein
MNILTIFKLLATLLTKWGEYVQKKKIEAELIKESEKVKNENIAIAQSVRDDAHKLQESTDSNNRDN